MPKFKGRFAIPENIKIIAKRADGSPILGWEPNARGMAYYRRTGKILQKPGYGEFKEEVNLSNLITNAGVAGVASRIGLSSTNAFNRMAVGTSNTAAAATDTALVAEITDTGLERASVTPTVTTTTVTNDTIQWQHTYTATGTKTIQEFGILNAASGGDLLCRRVVGPYALNNGDSIQFTYKIDVSAS